MHEEIECIVAGRVQRVMFRDFVQRSAKRFEVFGEVENMEDGTVRVLAQGMPNELKQFIEVLHEGSILSKVESIGVTWRSPTGKFDDFYILY